MSTIGFYFTIVTFKAARLLQFYKSCAKMRKVWAKEAIFMYMRHKNKDKMCWGYYNPHPGTVVHWHEYYEIEYIISGKARMSVNGVTYEYGAGYLSFVSPNDFHHFESLDGKLLNRIVLDIREEALTSELRQFLSIYKPPFIIKADEDSDIVRLLKDFYFEYSKQNDEFVAKHTAYLAFSRIIREVKLGNNLVSASDFAVNDSQLKSIKMILQYIDFHYNEKLTRDDIAEKFGYSPGYLSKLFKKVLGEGLFEHIIGLRIKKARELIMNSDLQIGEIIRKVGYNSPSLFYKHFSEHYKMMPYEIKMTGQ